MHRALIPEKRLKNKRNAYVTQSKVEVE